MLTLIENMCMFGDRSNDNICLSILSLSFYIPNSQQWCCHYFPLCVYLRNEWSFFLFMVLNEGQENKTFIWPFTQVAIHQYSKDQSLFLSGSFVFLIVCTISKVIIWLQRRNYWNVLLYIHFIPWNDAVNNSSKLI